MAERRKRTTYPELSHGEAQLVPGPVGAGQLQEIADHVKACVVADAGVAHTSGFVTGLLTLAIGRCGPGRQPGGERRGAAWQDVLQGFRCPTCALALRSSLALPRLVGGAMVANCDSRSCLVV